MRGVRYKTQKLWLDLAAGRCGGATSYGTFASMAAWPPVLSFRNAKDGGRVSPTALTIVVSKPQDDIYDGRLSRSGSFTSYNDV